MYRASFSGSPGKGDANLRMGAQSRGGVAQSLATSPLQNKVSCKAHYVLKELESHV